MAKQITEEQVERIVEKLVDRIEEANTQFLKSIGSSIKAIKELTPTEAQQLVQILKYGGKYEDIVKEIAKYTDLNIKDVDEIFSAYAKKDQMFYKQFYEYRNKPFIPFEQNVALQTQKIALANVVKNELYDFTRTGVLGYAMEGLDGKKHFYGLKETYNKVLDEALLNVSQGKETFDDAMVKTLQELGGSGLRTLEYKDTGYSMRLDSAVRMHLKSRLRELHNENQQIIGEEIGADGVEVSVHGNPAPDHADIQGRQFNNKKEDSKPTDWEKIQKGERVKDYAGIYRQLEHSKSGSYRPISELNCYHTVFSIILGVSKPEYTDEQLQQIIDDNEKGFEFEGQHYTNYEGTQMQRNLERAIRDQKDIQILAKTSDNKQLIAKSQERIRILTHKYQQLSEVSGLPTKVQRLRVSGYKRTKVK